jgi:uncharacterized protein YjbI with pentapeptide repeats
MGAVDFNRLRNKTTTIQGKAYSMLTHEEREQREAEDLEEIRLKAEQKAERVRLRATKAARRIETKAAARAEKAAAKAATKEAANAEKAATERDKFKEDLTAKMLLHSQWLEGKAIGERAVFRNTKKFKELDLSGFDFQEVIFTSVKIQNCIFDRASFLNARMKSSVMTGCKLTNCNLDGFIADNSDLRDNDFCGSTMYNGEFDKCELKGSTFKGTDLEEMMFNQCNLMRDVDLSGSTKLDPSNVFEYDEEE